MRSSTHFSTNMNNDWMQLTAFQLRSLPTESLKRMALRCMIDDHPKMAMPIIGILNEREDILKVKRDEDMALLYSVPRTPEYETLARYGLPFVCKMQ